VTTPDALSLLLALAVWLPTAGWALALEIGADMAKEVSALCQDTGRFLEIEIFQDYAGRDRVILAQAFKS